ncbi:hypothetical protein NA56DRAFT_697551 [Hyaloscypha hepaticicola]|uniref:Uncharacterized protein n=1 Tax=Hyaloscypha hepaticicola TaxID=2082293 RepID=A0A2J6QM77_9HELO|nr:hypothetical protein NA56DRAFT_697551 [Hyaloscypha hepaticicola]
MSHQTRGYLLHVHWSKRSPLIKRAPSYARITLAPETPPPAEISSAHLGRSFSSTTNPQRSTQRHLDISAHCRSSSLAADVNVVGALQTTLHCTELALYHTRYPPNHSATVAYDCSPNSQEHTASQTILSFSVHCCVRYFRHYQRYRFVTGTPWSFAYKPIHDPSRSAVNIYEPPSTIAIVFQPSASIKSNKQSNTSET